MTWTLASLALALRFLTRGSKYLPTCAHNTLIASATTFVLREIILDRPHGCRAEIPFWAANVCDYTRRAVRTRGKRVKKGPSAQRHGRTIYRSSMQDAL